MRPSLLVALLVAAAPAPAAAYDPFEDEPPGAESAVRFLVTGWGGALVAAPGSNRSGGGLAGGEATLRLPALDLGVQAVTTWLDPGAGRLSPVVLFRLGQRFETRSGLEASLTVGLGAARQDLRWVGWFQVAVGGRVPLGPLFLTAELAFEQVDLLRLAAGVGVSF